MMKIDEVLYTTKKKIYINWDVRAGKVRKNQEKISTGKPIKVINDQSWLVTMFINL